MIAQETLDQIRERVSVAELVGETVTLKRSGRQLAGLCPFHSEKTPSFYVNDEEGFFHCFGCGKKGSVFDYVMELRGYSFLEAVRFLAGRAGIALIEDSPAKESERSATAERRRIMRIAAAAVSEVLHEILMQDPIAGAARAYLTRRGVPEEMVKRYVVGFFPSDIDATVLRIASRISEKDRSINRESVREVLTAIGILKAGPDSGATRSSAYRERIIFPITRSDGVPIAFGGRIIVEGSERPKYINSPESLIYSKRQTFFGLSQALPSVRKERRVFLVEGYLDVLSMVQLGFENAVATCGTAVTPEHVRVLTRFVDRTTVLFDADEAGRRAAANCFKVFLNSGIETETVLLPEGEDPNSLTVSRSREDALALLEAKRVPLLSVFLQSVLGGGESEKGADSASGSALAGKAARNAALVFAEVKNPVEREVMVRQAADKLGVSFQAMDSLVEDARTKKRPTAAATVQAASNPKLARSTSPRLESAANVKARSQPSSQNVRAGSSAQSYRAPVQGSISHYHQQLVISVLCEPKLATRLLTDLASLLSEELAGAALPESVGAFIREVSELQPLGIAQFLEAEPGASKTLSRENFGAMLTLLDRHGLADRGLLEEAIRQAQVGGGRPELVVADFSRVTTRQTLRTEIEKLRREETEGNDPDGALILAQRKLERRRSFERAAREGSQKPPPLGESE